MHLKIENESLVANFAPFSLFPLFVLKPMCDRNGGNGSLDPGNPLIVSTDPFVSISFELMGTFGCNTKNNLVQGKRVCVCVRERERERERGYNKKDQFLRTGTLHSSVDVAKAAKSKLPHT